MWNFDFDEVCKEFSRNLDELGKQVSSNIGTILHFGEEEEHGAVGDVLSPVVIDNSAANPQESDVLEIKCQGCSSPRIHQIGNSLRLRTVRVLKLPNTNGNFRDLGGLVSIHGKSVRYGRMFRHGQLSSVTDSGLELLRDLGLKTNVDFRTKAESCRSPNCFPSGMHQFFTIPISGGEHKLNLSEAVAKLDFSQIRTSLQHMKPSTYRRFVTANTQEFRQFTELLLDIGNFPLSFNCTAGNDRSGWAAAIVYMLLGIPKESIIEDYAISAILLRNWISDIIAKMEKHFSGNYPGANIDMDPIWRLLSVDPDWIEAGFLAIDETWGSVDAYLEEGLGVTPKQRQLLQEQLLEPTSF